MTTTTSTAIQTGLNEENFGIFESGPKQLQTLNDRDIYRLTAGTDALDGTVIAFTEVIGAFTASGVALDIDATNRLFGDDGLVSGGVNPTPGAADLLNASSGDPVYTVASANGVNNNDNDSVYLGVSTASSPDYIPQDSITDPGANIIFNYNTSIAYVKTDLDALDGTVDGVLDFSFLKLGTNADDNLIGTAATEIIIGFGGDDAIQGGGGDDEIDGGSGNDTISGQLGNDHIRGGAGNDLVFGGLGADSIDGGAGNDTLRGGRGNDNILGGAGNDLISGEQGNDVLDGGLGNDTVNGGLGNDSIDGGDGNDLLRGLEGNDTLNGGDGNDDLRGNDGDDILNGGDGNDVLRGQGDDDILNGGDGNDTLFGGLGDDLLNGGEGDNVLRGGVGDDTLVGGEGDDFLSGETGDDVLVGANGDDTLIGGLGADTVRGYGDGSDAAERDVLIGTNDGASDTFVLGEVGNSFYDQGGDADFALIRNIQIDAAGITTGFEDRIQLEANEDYFLADVSFNVPGLGSISGVGIYLDNFSSPEANDLIGVIENVFEGQIAGGLANDLFVI